MVIHLFGAYFGLAVSRVLHKASDVRSDSKEGSVYHSDLFAMIGNRQLNLSSATIRLHCHLTSSHLPRSAFLPKC